MVPTPTNDKVIVTVIKEEKVTQSGLIVTGDPHEEPAKGIVESIGSGVTTDGVKKDLGVDVGDTVVFPKYAGTEVSLNNKDYTILNYGDVLAKVSSEA
jgi:chaperonin GroES